MTTYLLPFLHEKVYSHLSLSSILQLMFFYCHKLELKIFNRESEISEPTVVDWYDFYCKICIEIMLNHWGLGKTFEVDEEKFGNIYSMCGKDNQLNFFIGRMLKICSF